MKPARKAGYSGMPLAGKLGITAGASVCAVDEVWSRLKLVVRKELRRQGRLP